MLPDSLPVVAAKSSDDDLLDEGRTQNTLFRRQRRSGDWVFRGFVQNLASKVTAKNVAAGKIEKEKFTSGIASMEPLKYMFLEITGFLAGDSEDSSIKFELDVQPEFEKAVMDILGWKNLTAECDGELPLTDEQIRQISSAINEQLPMTLDLFIGVRA